jgi:hypothetical protein
MFQQAQKIIEKAKKTHKQRVEVTNGTKLMIKHG